MVHGMHGFAIVTLLVTVTGKQICFNRFCLPEDYDNEVGPEKNHTVIFNPTITEVYQVRFALSVILKGYIGDTSKIC